MTCPEGLAGVDLDGEVVELDLVAVMRAVDRKRPREPASVLERLGDPVDVGDTSRSISSDEKSSASISRRRSWTSASSSAIR